MNKNEHSAGTAADKRTAADSIPSASLEQNGLLSAAFIQSLSWYDLQPIAMNLVSQIADKQLYEKLLEIYPLEEGQQYVGSLVNHYRGRLKNDGKENLVNQMCNNSMRRLIIGLLGSR
jgi:hypothetical protein